VKKSDLVVRYHGEAKTGSRADLTRLLYKGGASLRSTLAYKKIAVNGLGRPLPHRLALIKAFKEELDGRLTFGQSKNSVPHYLVIFSQFISFLDSHDHSFSISDLEASYLEYAEHLFTLSKLKGSVVGNKTAYHKAATLSSLFGSILGIPESLRLVNRTRLRFKWVSVKAVGRLAEKQNLEATFKQGKILVNIVEGLALEAIYGAIPLRIQVRAGLIEGDELLLSYTMKKAPLPTRYSKDLRGAINAPLVGKLPKARRHMVNLRIQAELLIFIAQTSMNLQQAKEIGRGAMKYKALGDSWLVRSYKNRRGGEVSFQIYKSYKPFLDRYRAFVDHFFPDSPYFFPQFDIFGENESLVRSGLSNFKLVREPFTKHGIAWVSPRELRNTRVNWLLRRSGDADLTAEMAQHTKRVLRDKYERPSQQRAMVEVNRFWDKHDPIKKKDLKASIISSRCIGEPESVTDRPEAVVKPNCINPSGCLWCMHHRDVDSEDYVWSLLTFRYLKTIEASMSVSRNDVPSDIVIGRLSEKILWFKNSSPMRACWVKEAQERIDEGDYHLNWSPIIEFLERS
jgi:hypothetical protein